jgi:predicted RNA-binding protein associated with RNAse of E/G family
VSETVTIHYRRPPDRKDIFRQYLLLDSPTVKVTFAHPVTLPAPVEIGGKPVLESGADAVWFTYPGLWHDIGRFHTADGRFTGVYANILTPPRFDGLEWHTTDLFLDIWIGVGEDPRVLDEDQLAHALEEGWIDKVRAERARKEASALLSAARREVWPPRIVGEWTRERALQALRPSSRED